MIGNTKLFLHCKMSPLKVSSSSLGNFVVVASLAVTRGVVAARRHFLTLKRHSNSVLSVLACSCMIGSSGEASIGYPSGHSAQSSIRPVDLCILLVRKYYLHYCHQRDQQKWNVAQFSSKKCNLFSSNSGGF